MSSLEKSTWRTIDVARREDLDRREVEDGAHALRRVEPDEAVDDRLGRVAGHRDDGDVDALLVAEALEVGDVADGAPVAEAHADLLVRGVEHGDQLEALLGEAAVAGQGGAQRAGAHDDHVPRALEAETALDLVDQAVDLVAHAARAELAEVREVLADLGRVQVDHAGELLGRDALDAARLELAQLAQVHGQARAR